MTRPKFRKCRERSASRAAQSSGSENRHAGATGSPWCRGKENQPLQETRNPASGYRGGVPLKNFENSKKVFKVFLFIFKNCCSFFRRHDYMKLWKPSQIKKLEKPWEVGNEWTYLGQLADRVRNAELNGAWDGGWRGFLVSDLSVALLTRLWPSFSLPDLVGNLIVSFPIWISSRLVGDLLSESAAFISLVWTKKKVIKSFIAKDPRGFVSLSIAWNNAPELEQLAVLLEHPCPSQPRRHRRKWVPGQLQAAAWSGHLWSNLGRTV